MNSDIYNIASSRAEINTDKKWRIQSGASYVLTYSGLELKRKHGTVVCGRMILLHLEWFNQTL